jgi:hypothetical protein
MLSSLRLVIVGVGALITVLPNISSNDCTKNAEVTHSPTGKP